MKRILSRPTALLGLLPVLMLCLAPLHARGRRRRCGGCGQRLRR